MYDYNFGISGDIKKNPEEFLIFVKRMLPRWANGTPDSECIAIFRILKKLRKKKGRKLILTETGCGASTLTLFLHCALYGGTIYSWDINASRGSFLKSVITESIARVFKTDVNKIWNFVGYNSADKNIGIQVLKEMNKKADFGFFDSLHTVDHVIQELKSFLKVASSEFVVAFDDAYYTYKHTNDAYINMLRYKLNLKKMKKSENNISEPISKVVKKHLDKNYKNVSKINDTFKYSCKKDIFFDYFITDRKFGFKMDMERDDKRSETFVAYSVK